MSGTTTSKVSSLARQGEEIYDREIRPRLGPEDHGKVVAIEVETGDYEIARDEIAADDRLRARHPQASFWFRKVGSRHFYRFGHHCSTAA
jgi:hypothetical protein